MLIKSFKIILFIKIKPATPELSYTLICITIRISKVGYRIRVCKKKINKYIIIIFKKTRKCNEKLDVYSTHHFDFIDILMFCILRIFFFLNIKSFAESCGFGILWFIVSVNFITKPSMFSSYEQKHNFGQI